jgi:DNA excision repair protein ERCC-4
MHNRTFRETVKQTPQTPQSLPVILIDTREQLPLVFCHLATRGATLQSGDYSILGAEELFGVERKTIGDLIGCVTNGRERFERELHRLRGYRFKRLLIVGTEDEIKAGEYHSQINTHNPLGCTALRKLSGIFTHFYQVTDLRPISRPRHFNR